MSYKHLTAMTCIALMLAAAASGADSSPPSTAAAEQRSLGVTGVPIDPSKKTVHVEKAPGKAKKSRQSTAQLRSQQTKTQARLAKHIENYSGNIHNAQGKEKLTAEMAGDLDAYKRQSLELYKMQRRGGSTTGGRER